MILLADLRTPAPTGPTRAIKLAARGHFRVSDATRPLHGMTPPDLVTGETRLPIVSGIDATKVARSVGHATFCFLPDTPMFVRQRHLHLSAPAGLSGGMQARKPSRRSHAETALDSHLDMVGKHSRTNASESSVAPPPPGAEFPKPYRFNVSFRRFEKTQSDQAARD